MERYEFSTRWFAGTALPVWRTLIPEMGPRHILEIGSYEGASACFLIDALASAFEIELHCVDTWGLGDRPEEWYGHPTEGLAADMGEIEARFDRNIRVAMDRAEYEVEFHKHRGFSTDIMVSLLDEGFGGHFDFIYVDGSHFAPDVLADAVLGFRLLRVGGFMAFDDYLWAPVRTHAEIDLMECPKPAIDAFTGIYCKQARILNLPTDQIFIEKMSPLTSEAI